jgi:uncharacterized cupredoxin-like copper-binding protein
MADPRRVSRGTLAITAAVTAALLTAGCGGDGGESAQDGAQSGTTGKTVTVTETDFAIQLPQRSLTPGTYTFVAQNKGGVKHALEVEGSGLEEKTEELEPGGTARLTVTLEKGKYELYCPVGDHKGRGMEVELTVG